MERTGISACSGAVCAGATRTVRLRVLVLRRGWSMPAARQALADLVVEPVHHHVHRHVDRMGEALARRCRHATSPPRRSAPASPRRCSGAGRATRAAGPAPGAPADRPAAPTRMERNTWRSRSPISRSAPSPVFSATLPVKPSVTTTSVVPAAMSWPSTKPWNCGPIWLARRTSAASRSVSSPFSSSEPTFSRPIEGAVRPSTVRANTSPMTANSHQVARVALSRWRRGRASPRRRAPRARSPPSPAGRSRAAS